MKKFTILALTTLTIFSALAPVMSTDAEARHRHYGRNVGLGILGTAAAVAIIANSNRAYADDRYSSGRSFRYTCRKWYRQCEDGSNYACEKYDRRGC